MSVTKDVFNGDVDVTRNLQVGGTAEVGGNATFKHNLIVEGWLTAANIKGTNRGVYATADSLPSNPQEGWCAGVGKQSPFELYMVVDGEWAATGSEYVVEKGDTGDTGDDGKSAYTIAKEQGYEGTEEEWIASLKGTDAYIEKQTEDEDHNITIVWNDGTETFIQAGVAGEKGEQGEKGEKGDTGAAGGVIYPTFSINSDDGHLYCYVPTTEADISAEIADGHLILTVA